MCSGTTGAPKGVEVTHENIVNGIAALQTYTEQIGIEVRLARVQSVIFLGQISSAPASGLFRHARSSAWYCLLACVAACTQVRKASHPCIYPSNLITLQLTPLHARLLQVTTEDSTLSYLPLAHIFDRIVEEFALYSGARIGYFQVKL